MESSQQRWAVRRSEGFAADRFSGLLSWTAAAFFALAAFVSVNDARAASLSSSASVSANINNAAIYSCGPNGTKAVTGTDSVPNVNCIGPGWSETAAASAEWGNLHALADVRLDKFSLGPADPLGNNAWFYAKAQASYVDTLLFSSGATWEFTVSLSGMANSINGSGVSHPISGPGVFCFDPIYGGCISGFSMSDIGTRTYDFPIPKNGVLNIAPTLLITLEDQMFNVSTADQPITRDTYVDLSHTAKFVSSKILDANGNPITDATITSASGFNYLNPTPSVPEPQALAGMALGLLAVAWRCRGNLRPSEK